MAQRLKMVQTMKSKIVIYGAGMADAMLASRLAEDFDVTVVAPTNYFEVPMAMPRLMVQPGLADKAIISIADALPKVRHIHGQLAELTDAGGLVDGNAGARQMVTGDISVLAPTSWCSMSAACSGRSACSCSARCRFGLPTSSA
jgi:hypothetical protein